MFSALLALPVQHLEPAILQGAVVPVHGEGGTEARDLGCWLCPSLLGGRGSWALKMNRAGQYLFLKARSSYTCLLFETSSIGSCSPAPYSVRTLVPQCRSWLLTPSVCFLTWSLLGWTMPIAGLLGGAQLGSQVVDELAVTPQDPVGGKT